MFAQENTRQVKKQGTRRLIGLLGPYKGRWALATLLLVLSSAISLTIPQGVRVAIDSALAQGDLDKLSWLLGAALLAFLLLGTLTFCRSYLMGFLGQRVVADLRVTTFQHLLCHPPGFFQERKSGELISRLTSDIQMLHFAVGSEMSIFVKSSLDLAGGLVLIFLISPSLSAVMLLSVPPLALGAVWVGRKIRSRSRELQDQVASANSRLKEAIVGIDTVQTFRAEASEADRYRTNIFAAFASAMTLTLLKSGFYATAQFGFYSVIAVISFFGAQEVLAGTLSAGEWVGFMIYTAFIGSALLNLAQIWGNLQSALGASERIFDLIDQSPNITSPLHPTPLPTPRGDVRFDAVSFHYPTRPDVPVLNNVTFHIPAGRTLALVGPSGAGKTTLTALLLRFYDPDQGQIQLDGVDLRDLSLTTLRSTLATVSQEPMLFSGTIDENIRFGFPDATRAQLEQIAGLAKVDEFTDPLPQGLDTLVGERGVKLSGGQRQRIAIARALLADPQLLILDEATSHLDTQNEALVQQALDTLQAGRTTLIIAHRLSTVRNADSILVLDQGTIVQQGTHDELASVPGVYATLNHSQWGEA